MNIQTTFLYNNLSFQSRKIDTVKKLTQKETDKLLRNNLILDYAKKGTSPFKIAEMLKISYDTVHRVIKRNMKKGTVEARRQKIYNLLMQGLSRKEIAEKVHVSIGTVHNVAHENKTYRTFKHFRDNEISKLLEQGILCKEIAKIWNVSVDTVWRINKIRKNKGKL